VHKFSEHLLSHLKFLNARQRHKASLIVSAHKYKALLDQIQSSPRIWAPLLYNRPLHVASATFGNPPFSHQPDNGSRKFSRNSGNYIPVYTASHTRELESSLCVSQSCSVLQKATHMASYYTNIPLIRPQVKECIQYRVMTRLRDSPEYPKSTDQTDFFHQSVWTAQQYTKTHKENDYEEVRKYSNGCRQRVHKIRTSSKFCSWQEAILTTTQTLGRYANSNNRDVQNRESTVFNTSVCSRRLNIRVLFKPK